MKDLRHLPTVEIFHEFLPSAFFMFFLFLCVEYLLPILVTGSVSSFFGLFFVLFSCFCLSVLSCVLFGGESLLPCAPRVGAMN